MPTREMVSSIEVRHNVIDTRPIQLWVTGIMKLPVNALNLKANAISSMPVFVRIARISNLVFPSTFVQTTVQYISFPD